MSVIQKIRDRGAWIVFGIIALALIAFILQDGVRSGNSSMSNISTLGKVNGTVINRTDFERKLELFGKGQDRDQFIGKLWESEVNSVLLNQECKKLGLQVSSKELSSILFGPNSPLKNEFTDPQTGVFNADQARAAFDQIKKTKNKDQQQMVYDAYIEPTIEQTLQIKYQSLIQESSYVPKWLVNKQLSDDNLASSSSYVYVPYNSIADKSVPVSDAEILSYAKKHYNEYKTDEETRNFSYITFNAGPTKADSDVVRNSLLQLKNAFVSDKNASAFLEKNSSDVNFYDGLIGRAQIKQPIFTQLEKLPSGTVYGPYVDGQDFVLAKMVDVKQIPDSVKVRQILVATQEPDQQNGGGMVQVRDDSAAKKIMDTVQALLKSGKSFDSVCMKYSDDGSKAKGGVYNYFVSGQMVSQFNDFCFTHGVGAKGVVKSDYGYHYIEVLGQKGSTTGYKVAYLAKPIIASNETDNNASNAASMFAASCKNINDFSSKCFNIKRHSIPSGEVKENDFTVGNLTDCRSLIKWLYSHKVGELTDQPMRVGDKYVVAVVTAINRIGLPSLLVLRPVIEPLVRNEKKAQMIIAKFKGSSLESYASSLGVSVQKINDLGFGSAYVPGIGVEMKFTGAAFNKSILNKVSLPIAGTNGVFAIRPDKIYAKASSENALSVQQTLLQTLRMNAYRFIDALKKAAIIKDYRSKFF